jgi:hypothetical protein
MALAGCTDITAAHGDTPERARAQADAMARSFEARFTTPSRDTRYEKARLRIAQYAMAPSSLLRDTVWTKTQGSVRQLIGAGAPLPTGYALRLTATPPVPAAVGASVHQISLTTLGNDDYRWRTQVDHAIGTITPPQVLDVFGAMLRSAERPAADIRRDYRSASLQLTSVMGSLATLDTVRTVRNNDGSTSVTLAIRLHPDRIQRAYPDFSRYLRKYVSTARYEWAVRDIAPPLGALDAPSDRARDERVRQQPSRGTEPARAVLEGADTWFVAVARDDLLTLRFRTKNGALQPLTGPLRAMPDTVALQGEAFAKLGPFTVGLSGVEGRMVFVNSANEMGWHMTFTKQPLWHLPPVTQRFVRTPLRRPFEGEGALFRLTALRNSAGQTVAHRVAAGTVHESTIMRWIGALGFTAMDDFAGRVEQEEARFIAALMCAWRQDIRQFDAPARSGL